MSFLSKIFGGGLQGILTGADKIISKFKLSPSEKQQFQLEMEAIPTIKTHIDEPAS